MMRNKNTYNAQKILYIVFIFIFGSIAYVGAIDGVFQLVKGSSLWLFLIIVFFIIFVISVKFDKKVIKGNEWIVWIFIGIILRVIYYCFVETIQSSDFYQPTAFYLHLKEIGGYSEFTNIYKELDEYQVYYSLYPAWSSYMFIVHALYRLFGVHTSLPVGMNIILSGLMLWVYAKLLGEINIDKKTKNIIIALLACFPQMVMWDAVASPDHFTVLFLAILVYIWHKCVKSKKMLLCVLAEAICISIIGMFKPLTPLMIILLICADIFVIILKNNCSLKQFIIKNLLIIILTVGISGVVNYCNKILLENYIKTEVQQATSFYLLWGYSVDEYGNWDSHAADNIINGAFEQAKDMADVLSYTDRAAVFTIKKNVLLMPKILWQKFRLLFYSDNWSAIWSLTGNNSYAKWLNKNIYGIGGILTILNSFSLILMPFANVGKNKVTIFMSLGWTGYICFLVLAGIQTRYRYIMLPFQLVLTGMGYMECKKFLYGKYNY